jgi:hypothetical protein
MPETTSPVAGEQRFGRAHLGADRELALGQAVAAVFTELLGRAVGLRAAAAGGALVHLIPGTEVADLRVLRDVDRAGGGRLRRHPGRTARLRWPWSPAGRQRAPWPSARAWAGPTVPGRDRWRSAAWCRAEVFDRPGGQRPDVGVSVVEVMVVQTIETRQHRVRTPALLQSLVAQRLGHALGQEHGEVGRSGCRCPADPRPGPHRQPRPTRRPHRRSPAAARPRAPRRPATPRSAPPARASDATSAPATLLGSARHRPRASAPFSG